MYINGKFMGHTDEFSNQYQRLLLNPGEYVVKLMPSRSGSAHEQQIKVEADKTWFGPTDGPFLLKLNETYRVFAPDSSLSVA